MVMTNENSMDGRQTADLACSRPISFRTDPLQRRRTLRKHWIDHDVGLCPDRNDSSRVANPCICDGVIGC